MPEARPELSSQEGALCAGVAYEYYINRVNQTTIAEMFGCSQSQVSKYLKLAEDYQLVNHVVDLRYIDPVRDASSLESRLVKKFDCLKAAAVAPVAGSGDGHLFRKELGLKAAKVILDGKYHAKRFGLSCGNSLGATISSVAELKTQGEIVPHGTSIYSLLTAPAVLSKESPTCHVMNLGSILPDSKAIALQLPPFPPFTGHVQLFDMKKSDWENNRGIEQLMKVIEELDVYLTGIGVVDISGLSSKHPSSDTHEFNAFIGRLGLTAALGRIGAVGECLFQPFNDNGELLIEEDEVRLLLDNLISLPLEKLRERVHDKAVDVIAIAGGRIKHASIAAALRGELCNVLVVDYTTAEYLLRDDVSPTPTGQPRS